jgi:hypothetical protein
MRSLVLDSYPALFFLGILSETFLEVNINEDLNQWLYGSTLDTISYLQEMFESQKK